MKPNDLETLLAKPPFAAHRNYLRGIARPSVEIRLDDTAGEKKKSRFGGQPYVPAHFIWPVHEEGIYRFLGQIDFADIESPPPLLPSNGLLSFFYRSSNDCEFDLEEVSDEEIDALLEAGDVEILWQEGDVLAYYWQNYDGFKLREGTLQWQFAEGYEQHQFTIPESKETAIHLSVGVDLPHCRILRDDWPFDQSVADSLFAELRKFDAAAETYLLGYPDFLALGYNPTPSEDWISLLTIDSILDWCWHDGGKLMVFIETAKLAEQDFSQLKCDAG